LEDGDYFVGEVGGGAGAVEDRRGLKAVEFVEFVVYGCVAGGCGLVICGEWRGSWVGE